MGKESLNELLQFTLYAGTYRIWTNLPLSMTLYESGDVYGKILGILASKLRARW